MVTNTCIHKDEIVSKVSEPKLLYGTLRFITIFQNFNFERDFKFYLLFINLKLYRTLFFLGMLRFVFNQWFLNWYFCICLVPLMCYYEIYPYLKKISCLVLSLHITSWQFCVIVFRNSSKLITFSTTNYRVYYFSKTYSVTIQVKEFIPEIKNRSLLYLKDI